MELIESYKETVEHDFMSDKDNKMTWVVWWDEDKMPKKDVEFIHQESSRIQKLSENECELKLADDSVSFSARSGLFDFAFKLVEKCFQSSAK